MAINIVGLFGVILFYIIIAVIGCVLTYRRQWLTSIWNAILQFTARKTNESVCSAAKSTEKNNMGGQSFGIIIGSFTITAGWVGGSFITGTSEQIFAQGLFWTQAPFAYSLSLLIGMEWWDYVWNCYGKKNYVTMLDPFQRRYGNLLGGMLLIPAFVGELFWSLSILTSISVTLGVILDIRASISVTISVVIVIVSAMLGGLPLLANTDLVQLSMIIISLWIAVPVILCNPAVASISQHAGDWSGFKSIDTQKLWVLGGIPWQTFFQKILSCNSPKTALGLSFASTIFCLLVAIPPILIGASATTTDWTNFTSGKFIYNGNGEKLPHSEYLLPTVFVNLLPSFLLFICLGSLTASAVSSTVSSMLGASTMISHNLYHKLIRPQASQNELKWLLRAVLVLLGCSAIGLSFTVTSVYQLWFLSCDMVYIILFPRLLAVIYVSFANGYGCVLGSVGALLLRILFGEESFHLPSVIVLPPIVGNKSLFPFRTFCMIVGFALDVVASWITHYLFVVKKEMWLFMHKRLWKDTMSDIMLKLESIHSPLPTSKPHNNHTI